MEAHKYRHFQPKSSPFYGSLSFTLKREGGTWKKSVLHILLINDCPLSITYFVVDWTQGWYTEACIKDVYSIVSVNDEELSKRFIATIKLGWW